MRVGTPTHLEETTFPPPPCRDVLATASVLIPLGVAVAFGAVGAARFRCDKAA